MPRLMIRRSSSYGQRQALPLALALRPGDDFLPLPTFTLTLVLPLAGV